MISHESYCKTKEIKKLHEQELLKKEGVIGVGIGKKVIKGETKEQLCISIRVLHKTNQLPKEELIAKEYDGIPTDVIELNQPQFLSTVSTLNKTPDEAVYRPMVGGIQLFVLNPDETGGIGTLGMFVKKKDDEKGIYILSNHHVLGSPGTGQWQSVLSLDAKKKLLVSETYEGEYYSDADCGLAKVYDRYSDQIDASHMLEAGKINGEYDYSGDNLYNLLGTKAKKRGRTTRLTYGYITLVDYTVKIKKGEEELIYTDQIEIHGSPIEFFALGGDSGSIVLSSCPYEGEDNMLIGLLFAASYNETTGESHGVASRFDIVKERLNITRMV